MPNYKIFHCPRCRRPLYCPETQKTKKCPKCNKLIPISHQKILKITSSLEDAIFIVQNLALSPELRKTIANSHEKLVKLKSKKDKFWEFLIKLQDEFKNNFINEELFLKEALQQGFSEDWVLKCLIELEKEGLILRPKEGYFQILC
jgi:DNA replicative helicase MCM subunit Mcm2 (Cdc46/Mcm family)